MFLQVTPSVYIQEMLQSTEERLANTNEIYRPRILELLDMNQSTNHKVNANHCCLASVALIITCAFTIQNMELKLYERELPKNV